jgi:hypothetical protein
MYCTNCGTPRTDDATACASCGTRVRRFAPQAPVNNYLVPAVLVTLCCCLPGGVVAIIYAAQVNTKLAAGDIAGAMAASRNAKMWTWISAGAGVLVGIAYGALMMIGGFAQGM